MESGQRNKLEFVSHLREFPLEVGDRSIIQVFLPIERRRTVVSEHLAWIVGMHGLCKAARFLEIGMRSLTPDQVSIRSIGNAARNGRLQSSANSEETFRGPFSGNELS